MSFINVRDVRQNGPHGNDAMLLVQPMRISKDERPTKSGGTMFITRVILLCRLVKGDLAPLEEKDQIEMVDISFDRKTQKWKLQKFPINVLLVITNFSKFLKRVNRQYSPSAHEFELQYSIGSGKTTQVLTLMNANTTIGEECPSPLSRSDYFRQMRFNVVPMNQLGQNAERKFASICGVVEFLGNIRSTKDGKRTLREITVKDSSNHAVMVTAFGECCSSFDDVHIDDPVLLLDCSVGNYKGLSLTFNNKSELVSGSEGILGNTLLLSLVTTGHDTGDGSLICLTAGAPQRQDTYVPSKLSDLLDNAILLNESLEKAKFEITCNIVGFKIDGCLWKYHCSEKMPNTGLSCFRLSQPTKTGEWVCNLKRPDGSLPNIDGETEDFQKERNHTGHVTKTVLARTAISVELRDPSLNEEQVVVAMLKHECVLALLDKDQFSFAELDTAQVRKELCDIIDVQSGGNQSNVQDRNNVGLSRSWVPDPTKKTYEYSLKTKLTAKFRKRNSDYHANRNGNRRGYDQTESVRSDDCSYFVTIDSLEKVDQRLDYGTEDSWDVFG